jgi:hypothetical protein
MKRISLPTRCREIKCISIPLSRECPERISWDIFSLPTGCPKIKCISASASAAYRVPRNEIFLRCLQRAPVEIKCFYATNRVPIKIAYFLCLQGAQKRIVFTQLPRNEMYFRCLEVDETMYLRRLAVYKYIHCMHGT